ncbi:unnamed protein product [Miscanthus lutarioriparius]|uniref:Uncharacterized protein n=1 Tax=Miscanthus lutarioriparius TaxID=422564 RepID=A0A811NUR2_9POAL|nr:unnamed protein product [Miscanthus lutarioriparius]
MDPHLKLILDELQQSKLEFARRFDSHEERWERRFADLERDRTTRAAAVDARFDKLESAYTAPPSEDVVRRLDALESDVAARLTNLELVRASDPVNDEREARVAALEAATNDISSWRPEVEGVVDDLRLKVQKVSMHYDRAEFDSSSHSPGLLIGPTSTVARLPPVVGHGSAPLPRDIGSGSFAVPIQFPANAYNKAVDPVFYVTRFVDGLRPEIRSVIIVQRPQSLDAACTLALLQEEAGVGGTKDSSRSSSVPAYKPNLKNAMPLPLLPAATKTQAVVAAPAQSDAESKLSALKAYRRAMGLCFKCGLKWSKDHKCSQEVLHAVQDIWESLSAIGAPLPGEDVSTAPEQLFLAISSAVTSGAPAYSTIQFVDTLGGIPVTILLDSGSTSSFVSESLVMQLSSQPNANSLEA